MLKRGKRERIELLDKLEDLKTQKKFLRGGGRERRGLATRAILGEGVGRTLKLSVSGMVSSQTLPDRHFFSKYKGEKGRREEGATEMWPLELAANENREDTADPSDVPGGSQLTRVAAGRGWGLLVERQGLGTGPRGGLGRGEQRVRGRGEGGGVRGGAGLGRAAVVERVGEDHRRVDAFGGGGAQVLQVQAGGGAAAVPAGGARAAAVFSRSLVRGQLLRDELGGGREAAPHTVLDDDVFDEGLVGVADEALVHHVASQQLGHHLQLVRGGEAAAAAVVVSPGREGGDRDVRGRAEPGAAARGQGRGGQQLEFLPDILAGRRRLELALLLLVVEVLLLVAVKIRLHRIVVEVVVPVGEADAEGHRCSLPEGAHKDGAGLELKGSRMVPKPHAARSARRNSEPLPFQRDPQMGLMGGGERIKKAPL